MKAIIVKIAGKTYNLAFNGAAMFEIREKYDSVEDMLEITAQDDQGGFIAMCETVALLATQGELARRYFGYDPQEMIEAETIQNIVQPHEIIELTTAIPRAVALGFGAEIDRGKDDEIDLTLMELNQKKTV